MGNTKTQTNSTQTATPTAQEQQLLNNEVSISNANVGNQESINNNSAGLINSILTGSYQGTAAGISNNQTQSMVNASLRDIAPQFQTSGILNSGESAQIAGRTAMDTLNANAQFNVEAQQNLMNAGLGNASSWSGMNNQNNANTGSELAGLRTINGRNVTSQNPFLNAFYTGLGTQGANTLGAAANAGVGAATGGASFGKSFMTQVT